ncbi:Integral membrane protein [Salmonella enterica subsp. enterica serovar Give str. S5-487]|nr:Integral membrane protein [Salmonella enterica subsp. enterica serovar Give str. S5-487]
MLPFLRLPLLVAVWPSFSGVIDSSRIYGNAQQVILIFSFFEK